MLRVLPIFQVLQLIQNVSIPGVDAVDGVSDVLPGGDRHGEGDQHGCRCAAVQLESHGLRADWVCLQTYIHYILYYVYSRQPHQLQFRRIAISFRDLTDSLLHGVNTNVSVSTQSCSKSTSKRNRNDNLVSLNRSNLPNMPSVDMFSVTQ